MIITPYEKLLFVHFKLFICFVPSMQNAASIVTPPGASIISRGAMAVCTIRQDRR